MTLRLASYAMGRSLRCLGVATHSCARHAHVPSIAPASSTGPENPAGKSSIQAQTGVVKFLQFPRTDMAGSSARTHPRHLPSNAAKIPAPQARPSPYDTVYGGRVQRGRRALSRCSSWSPRVKDHVESHPTQSCGTYRHPATKSHEKII